MNETKLDDGLTPLMPYLMPSETSATRLTRLGVKRARSLVNTLRLGLIGGVLLLLAIGGCTTKTVTLRPDCIVPELAPLPVLMSDDMECIADDVYWGLMDRERLLTDWALEMEATLESICKKSPE